MPLRRMRHGFGFLELVIVLGITGVALYVFFTFVTNNIQVISMIQERSDFENMRRHIRISMDCEKTKEAASPCWQGKRIKILRKDGNVIVTDVPSTVTTWGNWHLAAMCASSMPDYILLVKKINEDMSKFRNLFPIVVGC